MRRRNLALGVVGAAAPLAAGTYLVQRRLIGDPRNSATRRFEAAFDAAGRAMATAPAVADSISKADTRALESALLPLQVAHKVELVDVLGADGKILLALRSDRYRDRAQRMIDKDAAKWPVAASVLSVNAPSAPTPSSAAIIHTSWGDAIYRALPVAQNGRVVGAILIGTPLDEALGR